MSLEFNQMENFLPKFNMPISTHCNNLVGYWWCHDYTKFFISFFIILSSIFTSCDNIFVIIRFLIEIGRRKILFKNIFSIHYWKHLTTKPEDFFTFWDLFDAGTDDFFVILAFRSFGTGSLDLFNGFSVCDSWLVFEKVINVLFAGIFLGIHFRYLGWDIAKIVKLILPLNIKTLPKNILISNFTFLRFEDLLHVSFRVKEAVEITI